MTNINRILIIRLSSLGDILLTTPLIRSLKKNTRQLIIDFILREEYKDLLKLNPYIQNLFLYKRDETENKNLQQGLSENNYDLVIDLQNNFRSSKITSKTKFSKSKI